MITNIGTCHLENLGDRDGVLKAKTEIFKYLQKDGHIVLNGDDDKLCMVKSTKESSLYSSAWKLTRMYMQTRLQAEA